MRDLESVCKVAVVQATPVMFQKEKCVEKVLKLMEECAANGAQLIVFPELFIPGYPYGMTYGFTVGSRNQAGREDWKVYYDNSILAKGTEMQQIIDCAKPVSYTHLAPVSSRIMSLWSSPTKVWRSSPRPPRKRPRLSRKARTTSISSWTARPSAALL